MDDQIIILPIDICRICTNLQSNLNIITEKLDDENVLLHEALEFISCIRVDFNDGMSRTICITCCKKLSDAYKFKNQILDSYRIFYNQTSDFKFNEDDSNHDNSSEITILDDSYAAGRMEVGEPTPLSEYAKELGIKLSSNAVSFLLEHNNSKSKNKVQTMPKDQTLQTTDEAATKEQNSVQNNDLLTKENADVQTFSICAIDQMEKAQENSHLLEDDQMDNYEANSIESDKEYSEQIQTKENKPPLLKNHLEQLATTYKEANPPNEVESSVIREEDDITQSRTSQKTSKLDQTNNNGIQKKKYPCHICHKSFPRKSNYQDHLRYHGNEKNFVCSFCNKAFVQVANYRTHLRVHTKERPYHCHLCSKTYSQASLLKTHIRAHTNERNYVCGVCSKAFTNSSDLGKHKRIHDPSQKFACSICGHLFSQKVNLRIHQRKLHSLHSSKDENS